MNRAHRRMARTLPSGVLAVEINPTTRERLATLAAQRGCTIADLVRAAVDCRLDDMMDRATASWSAAPDRPASMISSPGRTAAQPSRHRGRCGTRRAA